MGHPVLNLNNNNLTVVSSSARDGDIGSVDAGGGLETDDGVGGVRVASIAQVLSRDSGQQRGSKGLQNCGN